MSKSKSCNFYKSLTNRLEKIKFQNYGAVGVAANIWNKLNLRIEYKNLSAEFSVSRFDSSWDLCIHTDKQSWIHSATEAEHEYIYFMGSVTPPYASYIHVHTHSIPFF